eukprot:3787513-Amphidinium_carterae.1
MQEQSAFLQQLRAGRVTDGSAFVEKMAAAAACCFRKQPPFVKKHWLKPESVQLLQRRNEANKAQNGQES